MPTDDYIHDAIDSLNHDPDCSYVLIAAHFGRPECHFACHITTHAGLEWMQRRFQDLVARAAANLDPEES